MRIKLALARYYMGGARHLQAGCLGVASVLSSYSLRILMVFSWCFARILLLYAACHSAAAAASPPRRCRVMATHLDTKPGRLFISLFSVARFGLVFLHDVDRTDDP